MSRRIREEPLMFRPETLLFHPSTASSHLLELRNKSNDPVRFEIHSTDSDLLYSRPAGGVIPPQASRGVEVVSAYGTNSDRYLQRQQRSSSDADVTTSSLHPGGGSSGAVQLTVQYRHEPKGGAHAGTSFDHEELQYWTKTFTPTHRRLTTPTTPDAIRIGSETKGNPAGMLQTPPAAATGSTNGGGEDQAVLSELDMIPFHAPVDPGAKKVRVQVVVRIRPFLPQLGEKPTSHLTAPLWRVRDKTISSGDESGSYSFDGILFPHCDNTATFNACDLRRMMHNVLKGYNCTFFAYGHTGSGKTHTVLGSENDFGMAQKCVEAVFQRVATLPDDCTSKVTVSFLEVYSEDMYDLLRDPTASTASSRQGGGLSLRADAKGDRFVVVGMVEKPVSSATAAIAALEEGCKRRRFGWSHVHDRSSRSHCLFRITTSVSYARGGSQVVLRGEANIVDLAGSEAMSDDAAVDRRETTSINLSLTYLKRVIMELSRREKFVSYRNSTLTKLLKHSLGGNARTVVVCNITLSELFFKETKATLLFGSIAKTVTTDLVANEEKNVNHQLLLEENNRLKSKLRMLEGQLKDVTARRSTASSLHRSKRRDEQQPETISELPEIQVQADANDGGVVATRLSSSAAAPAPRPSAASQLSPSPRRSTLRALSASGARARFGKAEEELVILVAETIRYLSNGTPVLLHLAAFDDPDTTQRPPPQRGTLQLEVRAPSLIFTPTPTQGGVPAPPVRFSLHRVTTMKLRSLAKGLPPWICLASPRTSPKQGFTSTSTTPRSTCTRSAAATTGFAPRQTLPCHVRQGASPSDEQQDELHIAFRGYEDHEGWMVCLMRLIRLRPVWADTALDSSSLLHTHTLMMMDGMEEGGGDGDDDARNKMESDEYSFCVEHRLRTEQYLAAREYVLGYIEADRDGAVVTALGMRTATNLMLHEAEIVCEYLQDMGVLKSA